MQGTTTTIVRMVSSHCLWREKRFFGCSVLIWKPNRQIGREVLNLAAAAVKPGVTTDEIDRVAHEACIERNAYPSPLNYWTFPKSCCTSVNEVICHGIPDQYELQDGDIVNIDISTYVKGFHADLNETYLVGNVDENGRKLVDVTRECLYKAIEIGTQ